MACETLLVNMNAAQVALEEANYDWWTATADLTTGTTGVIGATAIEGLSTGLATVVFIGAVANEIRAARAMENTNVAYENAESLFKDAKDAYCKCLESQ